MHCEHIECMPLELYQTESKNVVMIFVLLVFEDLDKGLPVEYKSRELSERKKHPHDNECISTCLRLVDL